MARGRRTNAATGQGVSEATRARIIEATLETIRVEGMIGASARAIARRGGFNQASIYYHFGSIGDAVLAALREMSDERLARYECRLVGVDTLSALVEVGAELYREDVASGTVHILSQVMAASTGDERFAAEIGSIFQPWIDVVRGALERVLGPLGGVLPVGELATAISGLFLGVELLGALGATSADDRSVYDAMIAVARLVEGLLPAVGALASGGAVPASAGTATVHRN